MLDLNPLYALPDSTDLGPLEFDWQPFDRIWLFSSYLSLDESEHWFAEHLPNVYSSRVKKNDKLEYYFSDAHGTHWSILVADARNRSAVDNLNSYVQSKRLAEISTSISTGVIVVLFRHKEGA